MKKRCTLPKPEALCARRYVHTKIYINGSFERNCQANSVYGPNIEKQGSTLTKSHNALTKSQADLTNSHLLQSTATITIVMETLLVNGSEETLAYAVLLSAPPRMTVIVAELSRAKRAAEHHG